MPVQRAIMALTLAAYWHWRTIPELVREIGSEDAVERCIKALIEVGLLERHKASVRPTPAATHLHRLELP